jgi:gamma-glutamyl-gamma-aminobutyrate hydrolase PuuD
MASLDSLLLAKIHVGISVAEANTPSTCAIVKQIRELGATPILFYAHAKRNPEEDIANIHALILMGNNRDIAPESYIHRYPEGDSKRCVHPKTKSELASSRGRARAKYEERMLQLAFASSIPLLGICGGMQRINVMLGGTLHQHVPDLVGDYRHCQKSMGIKPYVPSIPLIIEGGTLLAEIAKDIPMPFTVSHSPLHPKVIIENSIHHQAVDILAPGLRVCGLTDGVRLADGRSGYFIKAIEADPKGKYSSQFLLGVQWHPEFGASSIGDSISQYLLNAAETLITRRNNPIDTVVSTPSVNEM